MSDHDLMQSVELARKRLTALRARLGKSGAAVERAETADTLRDLDAAFENLETRYVLVREILDRSSDAVFAKDVQGCYTLLNPRKAELLGRAPAEILGKDDAALLERENAELSMSSDREVMSTGEPRTVEEIVSVQGVAKTVLTTKSALYDAQGNLRGLIGIAHDITARKGADREAALREERLRSMATELLLADELERRSLVVSLHSGLGQDLALAKMRLSALRHSAGGDLKDRMRTIEQLIEQADDSVRFITFMLSPPSLHDLGLVPALQWLAEDIGERYGLEVLIEDDGAPKPADARIRVILFRAVRELLINAVTHGRSRRALVEVGRHEGQLQVHVKDEGVGFDPADAAAQGDGLFGIREQLKHVGGSVEIDSVAGRGTTVRLTAPLESDCPVST